MNVSAQRVREQIASILAERKARRENPNGTATYTYEQDHVHDFVWTADPNYREVRTTFSASTDVTPAEYAATAKLLGRTPDEVRLSDVEVIVLMQPSRMRQAARYVEAAKLGLKYFGLWYGRYPYRTLTVVDPAHGGGGAGGMEYPTLITAGTAWPLGYWPLTGLRGAEMVTVHEFGHQFWYGLVGNNEFEEAWLDEGFNSYSTGKVMELGYGHNIGRVRVNVAGGGARPIMSTLTTPQARSTLQEGSYAFEVSNDETQVTVRDGLAQAARRARHKTSARSSAPW